MEAIEKFFKLQEHGTTVKTELVAGLITFLSMVYILAINPTILADAGMNSGAVFTATAVSACVATLIMMPLTYSIANGIMFGMLAFVIVRVCQGRIRDVHWVMWVAAALFTARIVMLIV